MGYIGKVPADVLIDPHVDSAAITDGTIITADIADDAVTSAKLAQNSVDSSELIDGSVDNSHLAGSIAVNKTLLSAGTGLTLSTNTLNVDAAQTQITSVGTISTGVWQGTAIASAYLDADTAHLSGSTFTGSVQISHGTTPDFTLNDTGGTSNKRVFRIAGGGDAVYFEGRNNDNSGDGDAGLMTSYSLSDGTITHYKSTHLKGSAWNNILRLGDTSRSGEQLTHINNGSVNFSIYTSNGTKGVLTANHDGSAMTLGADYGSGTLTVTPPTTFSGNITIDGSSSRQIEFKDGSESEGAIVFDEITDGFIFKVGGTSSVGKTDAFQILNNGNATFVGNVQLSNGQQLQWGGTSNAIFGHHTNNYITMKTNGADRVTIGSDGNVTLSNWIYVENRVMGASGDIRVGSNDGNEMLHLLANGTAKIDTAGTTALTIDSSQNSTFAGSVRTTQLGVGVDPATGYELDVYASSGNANFRLKADGSNQGARLHMDSHSGDMGRITFENAGTQKAEIRSEVSSANIKLYTNGANEALCIDNGQHVRAKNAIGVNYDRVQYGWASGIGITSSAYYHYKTNLWMGTGSGSGHSGNDMYIMGGIHIYGYRYTSSNGVADTWFMGHNWDGTWYNAHTVNNGTWNVLANNYRSSDGFWVFVVQGDPYASLAVDLHQAFSSYAYRDIQITAYTTSSVNTGSGSGGPY